MRIAISLRFSFTIAFVSLMIVNAWANVNAQTPASAMSTISKLSWLVGDWQTAAGGRSQTDEHWTAPAGGSMLGLSRTVAAGRTHEFEYLRIEQRSDGIYYVAHPQARCPGTDFKLTHVTNTEAVFENPAHDFPKRITYRKTPEGSLVATVDGGPGSKSITLTYRAME